MEFLFAVLVIAAIAVFLREMSKAPQSPRFCDVRPVSRNAVLHRLVELSKSCGTTERGRGIDYERTYKDLESVIEKIEERISTDKKAELWEEMLCGSKRILYAAIAQGSKLSQSKDLGHINGVPRLFLFCDMLVGLTQGCFDKPLLKSTVEVFTSRSPFDNNERVLLNAMLSFCICGHLARAVDHGNERAQKYCMGFADGKSGTAALDLLSSCDYVCGLTAGAHGQSAIVKLLEDNGISPTEAEEQRRANMAELAAFTYSAISTLNCILNGDSSRAMCPSCNNMEFFGGETTVKSNIYKNNHTAVTCDNLGNVIMSDRAGRSVSLSVDVKIGEQNIRLGDMDGAFQRHRTVYRAFTDSIEVIAEIVSPPIERCCAVRLTLINRTSERLTASSVCSCCPSDIGGELEARHIKDIGIALSIGECEFGLSSNMPCLYSSNKSGDLSVNARREVDIDAFGKDRALFVVVTESRISAARLSMFDSSFFNLALVSSLAYYEDNRPCGEIANEEGRFALSLPPPDSYPSCTDVVGYLYERGNGGFTKDGYLTEVKTNEQRKLFNFLFDGDMFVKTSAGGDSSTLLSDGCTYGSLNVVLDECGVIWSPFGELSGDGARAEFCRGYTKYISYKNGCVTALTRSIARGKRAEVLLLEVENRTCDNRVFDVMVSACAENTSRILRKGDIVYALGKCGFALLSSVPPTEHCEYVEGYIDHGRIARAAHFKSGGETVAPTLSVNISLAPNEVKKIAFCRALISDGPPFDSISTEDVERCISDEIELYSYNESIVLKSSDPALNAAHTFSLYIACAGHIEYMRLGRYDRALLTCFAAKYADVDRVTDSVLEICEAQDVCGRVDVGRKTPIATLLLPLAVMDIVSYVGDCRLLSESVCFKSTTDGKSKSASVLEHCFRAIDFSILSSTRESETDDGAFDALLLRAAKAFIDYSANGDRSSAYSSVIARLSKKVERGHYRLATADIEFDPLGVATAYARYEADDVEYAYGAVSELTEKALFDKNGLPLMFSKPDGVTAALYYAVVSEKLLGVSVRGSKARICPNTSQNTPHIEFDICRDGMCMHIFIDDSRACGGWQICIDKISIASQTVSITGGDSIVMRRRENVV